MTCLPLPILRRRRFSGADAYAVLGYKPALVLDFDDEYYRADSAATTFSDALTHSASSNATMVDSDGLLKWRPHNLALNSATPATQLITVVSGADYTVECTGVSIALLGAGTGTVTEGNPVTITASTTTLTLTVTGSTGTMWAYRSDLGGMVNNPDRGDSYVPTTSTARYLPRRGHHVWNGAAWVNEGLLHESEARTNLALHSRDLSDAAWTKTDVTAAKTATAVTGETNGATTLTATAGNGTVTQAITSASALRVTSMWVKRRTGTGDIEMTQDGGSTWTAVTVTSGWTRVNLDAVTSTDPTVGIRIVTSGDEIDVDFFQHEVGGQPSSEIPTSGSTVTRAAETLTVPAAKLPWPTPNVIGPELVTNGTFDTDTTGWSNLNGFFISSEGRGLLTNTSAYAYAWQSFTTVAGKVYVASAEYDRNSSSSRGYLGIGTSQGTGNLGADNQTGSQTGTLSVVFTATGTTTYLALFGDASIGTLIYYDNISVREIDPLSVSIQMQGRATGDTYTTTRWYLDANNYITQEINASDFTFEQAASGTVDAVTGGSFTSGVNTSFNIASRHGSTFINGSVDGTALTANTTPTALPDLSSTDLQLGYDMMGTIKLFRVWSADLGDSGIAEASA